MNRNQQQMYKDISDLPKALTKLVKVIEKLAKQQHDQNKRRNTAGRIN